MPSGTGSDTAAWRKRIEERKAGKAAVEPTGPLPTQQVGAPAGVNVVGQKITQPDKYQPGEGPKGSRQRNVTQRAAFFQAAGFGLPETVVNEARAGAADLLGQGNTPEAQRQRMLRGEQDAAINMLTGAATGAAPSAAERLLALQRQQAMRDQSSFAASARGNPVAAARVAADNSARISSDMGMAAGAQRAQEQEAARAALVNAQAQRRGFESELISKAAADRLGIGLTELDQLNTLLSTALATEGMQTQIQQARADRRSSAIGGAVSGAANAVPI